MLAWLRGITARWDTPDTPRKYRHDFGWLVLAWLLAAVGVVIGLLLWEFPPVILITPAVGVTAGVIGRRRRRLRQGGEPELLPYQPADSDHDPWEHPTR